MNKSIQSENIIIHFTTYNRKNITEVCLKQIKKYKKNALLWVHDDESSEYDHAWLKQWADVVSSIKNPYSDPNQRSTFAVLNSLHLVREYARETNYSHIYHSDNDVFHDKTFMDGLCHYWNTYQLPVVLYTEANYGWKGPDKTIPHVPVLETFQDGFRSCGGQGPSWLFPVEKVELMNKNLQGSWDSSLNPILGANFIFAKPALADQYIYNGVHADCLEHNFTLNPTKYLKRFRSFILKKIGK